MAVHLNLVNRLVAMLNVVGKQMNETPQLVALLGSLPSEYDVQVSIVENAPIPSVLYVKVQLIKEFERSKAKESTETAFKARVVFTYGRGQKARRWEEACKRQLQVLLVQQAWSQDYGLQVQEAGKQ